MTTSLQLRKRVLWEEDGNGDIEEWVKEIREAMKDVVQEVTKDDWKLDVEQVAKIINRKKNWNSPSPDGIANFWWEKATMQLATYGLMQREQRGAKKNAVELLITYLSTKWCVKMCREEKEI